MRKKLIVFSGAGMSAESGLKTFRDNGGLWEEHDVYEVATPEAWAKNPELVLKFYNERRKQLLKASFNKAHKIVAHLETQFDVTVITQNIDDLHEKAGSKNVIHLHGELMKARCEKNEHDIYSLELEELKIGDLSEGGFQLRPHVVWFGEEVPMMEYAIKTIVDAEIFIVIGTSLNVYPAANLIHYLPNNCDKYLVDPNPNEVQLDKSWKILKETAGEGMLIIQNHLNKKSDSIK